MNDDNFIDNLIRSGIKEPQILVLVNRMAEIIIETKNYIHFIIQLDSNFEEHSSMEYFKNRINLEFSPFCTKEQIDIFIEFNNSVVEDLKYIYSHDNVIRFPRN